jgi:hypothetical protein
MTDHDETKRWKLTAELDPEENVVVNRLAAFHRDMVADEVSGSDTPASPDSTNQ